MHIDYFANTAQINSFLSQITLHCTEITAQDLIRYLIESQADNPEIYFVKKIPIPVQPTELSSESLAVHIPIANMSIQSLRNIVQRTEELTPRLIQSDKAKHWMSTANKQFLFFGSTCSTDRLTNCLAHKKTLTQIPHCKQCFPAL
jgi:hypothetical protein